MASPSDILPYGICPSVACKYSEFGDSESGNKLSCPDHARLHVYIDHGYTNKQVNDSDFDNSERPFKKGTKATTRLNPRVEESMPSILKGLYDLPKAVAIGIQLCPAKWKEGTMLLGLATKTIRKFNRPGSKTKDKMRPALNVWEALHGQDQKDVVAIQFVEDQLSEKEVASRAGKKTVGRKNQKRSKFHDTPTPAQHYATASCVAAQTGAFARGGDEVQSVPRHQGREGGSSPATSSHPRPSLRDLEEQEGGDESDIQNHRRDDELWLGMDQPAKQLRVKRRKLSAEAIHDNQLLSIAVSPRSMSYDTLEDHKEDLFALLSYFNDNIFPDENLYMEERRKIDRAIKMIEQLGKNDSKDMLAREIGSDISELLTWFSGVAAYQESEIQKQADFTDALTRQTNATKSKQCFVGVRSVFSSLRSSLESALVSVKKLEEGAKQQEAIQDQSIEENFLANKASLQHATSPYENGYAILKHIASKLGIRPDVPHYAWPSQQVLAPVVVPTLPEDVASYEKDLEDLETPLKSALKDAKNAFQDNKGKSLMTGGSALEKFQALRMPPPPPRFRDVQQRSTPSASSGKQQQDVQQWSTPSPGSGKQQQVGQQGSARADGAPSSSSGQQQLPSIDSPPEERLSP